MKVIYIMPISASYERAVPAKLFVHIDGEEPFEASEEDLRKFGYLKQGKHSAANETPEAPEAEPENSEEEGEKTSFDFEYVRRVLDGGEQILENFDFAKDMATVIIKNVMKTSDPKKK